MKNKLYLFFLIVSILTSCEENQTDKNTLSVTQKEIIKPKQYPIKKLKKKPKEYHLEFISVDGEPTELEIKANLYNFSNILQPIVLVNFFSTWCPPCRGEIPHLNNLHKKYKKKLFILGITLHDESEDINDKVKNCVTLKQVDYFISRSIQNNNKLANLLASKLKLKPDFELPMMVMFVYGEYYAHYEGTVPEEMIESDIKQALKDIED